MKRIGATNGTRSEYAYDARGNLTGLVNAGAAELPSYAFTYDEVGNIVTKNDSSYEYDRANRLLQAFEDYRYKAESAVAAPLYAEGDVAGRSIAKPVAASFEGEELDLSFDGRAASVGVDLRESRLVYELTLTPSSAAHGVTAASVEFYVSDSNQKGSWLKLDATVSIDGVTGRITVRPQAPVLTRYAKVHCRLDVRDDNLAAAQASFMNIASGILRIGYYAQSSSALYAYDAQGNRTGSTTTKGEASLGLSKTSEASVYHLWDNSDRIRKIEKTSVLEDGTAVATTWAYVYDALGNLIEKGEVFSEVGGAIQFSADSGHYVRYSYDLWNRLVRVDKGEAGTTSAKRVATYEYDPTGLRIRKVTSNTITEYVYGQDGNVLRETRDESSADAVTIDYVYALGKLAAWTETIGAVSTKYWAATDHLGSVTAATDANGTLAMRRDFSAFGDSKDAVLETAAGPRYTGKDYDEDAELYYFNARWYDAELARFTTEDPARDDINWYVYCANNPLTHTDPSGMQFTGDYGETSDGNYDPYEGDRVPTAKDWEVHAPTQEQVEAVKQDYQAHQGEFLAVGAGAVVAWAAAPAIIEAVIVVQEKLDTVGDVIDVAVSVSKGDTVGALAATANIVLPEVVEKVVDGVRGVRQAANAADAISDIAKRSDDVADAAKVAENVDSPEQAYNRLRDYGRTPTSADRKALGAGSDQVVDHNPPLVKRYYDGDPSVGEKPGYQMTNKERKASAQDRTRMQLQPKTDSNKQGARMQKYSRQKKEEFEL